MTFQLRVNEQVHQLDCDPQMPLLWVLRDELQLCGTKFGCGMAQCGACKVHVDGVAMPSCMLTAAALQGQSITTIEGLRGPVAAAVQRAWVELEVAQCGYCQPGQIMAATALLQAKPKPGDADIDAAMNGNICRCATYLRIRAAIHHASGQLAVTLPAAQLLHKVSA